MLKPQDVLVLLKLRCLNEADRTAPNLVGAVGLSIGEIYNSVKRLSLAGLANPERSGEERQLKISARRAFHFLVYGAPTVFYPERGAVGPGVLTATSAPLFDGKRDESEIRVVWPHEQGKARGETLQPVYASAPAAALRDPRLYELLVAFDVIRICTGKERKYAVDFIERSFPQTGPAA